MKQLLLIFTLASLPFNSFAQEAEESSESKHSIAFVLGHARIGQGRNFQGEKEFLMVPSLGFDYNYRFNEKWGIGLHTDLLNENFFVENEKGEILERERPIAPALVGIFKPSERWSISLGFGREFSPAESLNLTRLSVEYGTEIRKGWEVFGLLSQDFRWATYNVTSLGIGISKKL
ncbi:hypothetical protein [Algoriphagus namhaensis]